MKGIRAFGRNEGGLNHVGDFMLLFSPVVPFLAEVAVFKPELQFPWCWEEGDPQEKLVEELSRELAAIELKPRHQTRFNAETKYYGAGFFPKFAAYVQDDWNEMLCFKPPFPEYEAVYNVAYSTLHAECFRQKDFTAIRKHYLESGFYAYFRNVDACFWECYARDEALVDALRQHLNAQQIEFEELEFEVDYPYGGLKMKRSFKEVHSIWPRDRKEQDAR